MSRQTQLDEYFRSMAVNNSNRMQQVSTFKLPYKMCEIMVSDDSDSEAFEKTPTKFLKKRILNDSISEAKSSQNKKEAISKRNINNASKLKRKASRNRKKKSESKPESSPAKQKCTSDTTRQDNILIMAMKQPTVTMHLNSSNKKVKSLRSNRFTSLTRSNISTSGVEMMDLSDIEDMLNTATNSQTTSSRASISSQTISSRASTSGQSIMSDRSTTMSDHSTTSSLSTICSQVTISSIQISTSDHNTSSEQRATLSVVNNDNIQLSPKLTQSQEVISTMSQINLSQISGTTEEYDSDEYERTIASVSNSEAGISSINETTNLQIVNKAISPNKNQIKIINNKIIKSVDTSIAIDLNAKKKSHVSRNIFGADMALATKKIDKIIQVDMTQVEAELRENANLNNNRTHNMGTQVLSQEIIQEMTENVQTTVNNLGLRDVQNKTTVAQNTGNIVQNNTNSISIKKQEQIKEIVKKNEIAIKEKEEIKKGKVDERYSEENHLRLCLNIEIIGGWVIQQFGTLFSPENIKIYRSLSKLPVTYKSFCLRLFTRQHKWFNMEDICRTLNIEIEGGEKEKMVNTLVTQKLILTDYSQEPVLSLLSFLNRPQIREICVASKLSKTPNKKDVMINALVQNSNRQMTLSSLKSSDDILRDRINAKLGDCVKLSIEMREMLSKMHMLYTLANPELKTPNDIYWLLNKIEFEKIKYPKVQIDSVDIFQTSHELDRYFRANTLRKEFYEEMENKETKENCFLICNEAFERFKNLNGNNEDRENNKEKPLFLRRFSAAWVYCSVVSSGSCHFGKIHPNDVCKWLQFLLKQKIYCPNKRGQWYEQLALVKQSHLKNVSAAVEAIISGLNDKLISEISKHELSIRGRKIRKGQLSEEKYSDLLEILLPDFNLFPSRTFQANIVHENVPGRKKSFVRVTEEGKVYSSVEETAIYFYLEENTYTNGIHCEGSLLVTLFYLLFWDIIYNVHVPNTFISKIQCYPLDMYSGEFYKNRKSVIDARIQNIARNWTIDKTCEFISKILKDHLEELQVLLPYDFGSEIRLHSIVKCIGIRVLSGTCKRFVEDFRLFRSGLPDLFLWNEKEQKCCFVEVKSEKDKLSTKQILWLNYLRSLGAKIEVCHLQDIGSSRKVNPKKS